MLFIATNAGDTICNALGVVVVLTVMVCAVISAVHFIAGFIQMGDGRNWDGLNVTGFGGIGLVLSYMFFSITFFNSGDLSFYQSTLTGLVFVGIYALIIGFLRFCSVPWGIIFLVALMFVSMSI